MACRESGFTAKNCSTIALNMVSGSIMLSLPCVKAESKLPQDYD